ncbi:FAD-binding protein [Streptomyces sp. SID2888]|uniref:FAD-binding protein n=1 Tax=Streptomyces sp. SID2888 TaxID=2690256 RepID=UPI00136A25FA|nr:hypothetical protein [Streptomyces sp. SID2888]
MTYHTWALRTVALAKQVPREDLAGDLDANGRLHRNPVDQEMNPFCRRAVAQAVRFAQDTGGHSTVITMGPPSATDVVREALAWGADRGLHVCDPALAGADCLVTARALAAAIRLQGAVDLIAVGRNSVDGDTAAIGPMIAQLLGIPFVGPVLFVGPHHGMPGARTLQVRLQLDGAVEDIRITLPAVIAVAERSCTPAKAPREAWPEPEQVRVLTTRDLGKGPWGAASPTRVRAVRTAASTRGGAVFDHHDTARNVAEAVRILDDRGALQPGGTHADSGATPAVPRAAAGPQRYTLLAAVGDNTGPGSRALLGEAAALAERVGARVVALAPAEHARQLARWGADEVLAASRYDAGPLAAALARNPGLPPWAVLGPASPWGRELLARLAATWNAGLLSDVVELGLREPQPGNGTTSQSAPRIIGGKPCGTHHIAEIDTRSDTQIVTLRTGCFAPRRPRTDGTPIPVSSISVTQQTGVERLTRSTEDDYDALDRAEVVIGVGRGVEPTDYGRLNPLQVALGAELAATRRVTDATWLPHARQVGVTARTIAPRLYIATGISGSPLHMAGLGRAGTILAINIDPTAEIFAHSDAGIVGDWREVLPLLTEEIAQHLPRSPEKRQ